MPIVWKSRALGSWAPSLVDHTPPLGVLPLGIEHCCFSPLSMRRFVGKVCLYDGVKHNKSALPELAHLIVTEAQAHLLAH